MKLVTSHFSQCETLNTPYNAQYWTSEAWSKWPNSGDRL